MLPPTTSLRSCPDQRPLSSWASARRPWPWDDCAGHHRSAAASDGPSRARGATDRRLESHRGARGVRPKRSGIRQRRSRINRVLHGLIFICLGLVVLVVTPFWARSAAENQRGRPWYRWRGGLPWPGVNMVLLVLLALMLIKWGVERLVAEHWRARRSSWMWRSRTPCGRENPRGGNRRQTDTLHEPPGRATCGRGSRGSSHAGGTAAPSGWEEAAVRDPAGELQQPTRVRNGRGTSAAVGRPSRSQVRALR